MSTRLLEVCVDSLDGARAALRAGAQRIELCAELPVGGLTPSVGMIELASALNATVMVMVRPRSGDFAYSDADFEVMQRDVRRCVAAGVHGVVLGILTETGDVDAARTRALVECARPLEVTFHRAFDMTRDGDAALDALLELGVDRVLTSGQCAAASAGAEAIARWVRRAGDRLVVMPGGGITEENLAELVRVTGASEFHASARVRVPSPMTHRNARCAMGARGDDEYARQVTSEDRVRELVKILGSAL